jgi:hypothetical protein
MKPKMGRPKVPKGKLRDIIVNARFSPEEYNALTAAISRTSDNQSVWVRKVLLKAAKSAMILS